MRLNPYHPERFWHHLARAYFVARRYAEAIDACKRISTLDHQHHTLLAACHAYLGNEEAARMHADETLKLQPDFRVGTYEKAPHYRNESDRAHHREGMLRAGLPA